MATLPKTVQYVTDSEGRRVAVVVDIQAWESLVDWIENATDLQIAIKALSELHGAGGPQAAGWVPWDEARKAWE